MGGSKPVSGEWAQTSEGERRGCLRTPRGAHLPLPEFFLFGLGFSFGAGSVGGGLCPSTLELLSFFFLHEDYMEGGRGEGGT